MFKIVFNKAEFRYPPKDRAYKTLEAAKKGVWKVLHENYKAIPEEMLKWVWYGDDAGVYYLNEYHWIAKVNM